MWVWTRITSRKWEDAWVERLRFAGEERLTLQYFPNSARMRIQVYCDLKKTVVQIKRLFGGEWKKLKSSDWAPDPAKKRKPIAIRGRLAICTEASDVKNGCIPLVIPAGMAFGTGEHVTTASCLRFLCDIQKDLPPSWRMLDLGTGSGILALAGEKLGASRVDALDFDPACVRTSKANAKANRCRHIRIRQADVLKTPLRGKYDLVTANLFSEVLIAAAGRITGTLRPGSRLILSGILRTQLAECRKAFQKRGVRMQKTVIRGKWASALCLRER